MWTFSDYIYFLVNCQWENTLLLCATFRSLVLIFRKCNRSDSLETVRCILTVFPLPIGTLKLLKSNSILFMTVQEVCIVRHPEKKWNSNMTLKSQSWISNNLFRPQALPYLTDTRAWWCSLSKKLLFLFHTSVCFWHLHELNYIFSHHSTQKMCIMIKVPMSFLTKYFCYSSFTYCILKTGNWLYFSSRKKTYWKVTVFILPLSCKVCSAVSENPPPLLSMPGCWLCPGNARSSPLPSLEADLKPWRAETCTVYSINSYIFPLEAN